MTINFLAPPPLNVTTVEFLQAIFKENWPFAHVTGFPDDPSNIPADARGRCWAGTWAKWSDLQVGDNHYFTISIFNPETDDDGSPRPVRRKANFLATYCIVADDVKDKVPEAQARLLPEPSWKLETSPGNEQWGWILDQPATDRARVENLLDGLVAMGLAPDGTDPGMKGVTRYVRLPEGYNTKAKYGEPFRCRMVEWNPERVVTIEALAAPFGVDLNKARSDEGTGVLADIEDHPVLEAVKVLDAKGEGEYLIECPWVEEHTDGDNSGTILYTHEDGSIGFKCHHGHCQDRTGGDLLTELGVKAELDTWRAFRGVQAVAGAAVPGVPDFNGGSPTWAGDVPVPNFNGGGVPDFNTPRGEVPIHTDQVWEQAINTLPPDPTDNMPLIREIIRGIIQLPPLEEGAAIQSLKSRCAGFIQARAIDGEVREIRQQVQAERLAGAGEANLQQSSGFAALCQAYVYVADIDRFVNKSTLQMLKERAFKNAYCHLENEIQEFSESTGQPIQADIIRAVLNGPMAKVDAVDYCPGAPGFFNENGKSYLNLWNGIINQGRPGDPSIWLGHFDQLGIKDEDREHMLDWMACTLQRPEVKINHILMLGGKEGIGKDFLLFPMTQALGEHSRTIQGSELGDSFNEFLLRTKHLHVNEVEAGSKREKTSLTNHLKPLAAAPPHRLNVNQKGISAFPVRNVVNVTGGTNDRTPVDLMDGARRYYMVWSNATIRGDDGQMTPAWRQYWANAWGWMRDGNGWEECVYFLMTRDISHFDPRAVPRVTDHQKEVVESSMPGLALYLREAIDAQQGIFANDIVTPEKIFRHIKVNQGLILEEYGLSKLPDKRYIGKVLSEFLQIPAHRVVWKENGRVKSLRFYALRDVEKYLTLTGAEINNILERQPVPLPIPPQPIPQNTPGSVET